MNFVPIRRLLPVRFVLVVVLALSCRSFAFDDWRPISQEELKMTSEPQAPGAPAIILWRQVDRDDRGHTTHEVDYIRIKILTEEGRKYADVEIPFSKSIGNDVVHISARTIEPDGSITNYDGKAFEKYIVKA